MTLVFPDTRSRTFPRAAPLPYQVTSNENASVQLLPTTGNPLQPISQDTALAFAVDSGVASDFLYNIQELPIQSYDHAGDAAYVDDAAVSLRWVMNAANSGASSSKNSLATAAGSAWTGFVDLIKV